MLSRNKANLNETLRSAASEGDIEIVKLMLEKGAGRLQRIYKYIYLYVE